MPVPRPRPDPTLARLIRTSKALDASARRHWLAVLPHLTEDDRARLREILLGASDPKLAEDHDRGLAG